jgi:hypothetical protein
VSWLPKKKTSGRALDRPWLPRSLRNKGFNQKSVAGLKYVVVDERVGDHLGLSVASWPNADDEGRLRFDVAGGGPERVGIKLADLLDVLEKRSVREKSDDPAQPSVRIGDVFAAELIATPAQLSRGSLEKSLGAIYDVSSEARKVAKLAYYSAVAPVLKREQTDAWNLEELEER